MHNIHHLNFEAIISVYKAFSWSEKYLPNPNGRIALLETMGKALFNLDSTSRFGRANPYHIHSLRDAVGLSKDDFSNILRIRNKQKFK